MLQKSTNIKAPSSKVNHKSLDLDWRVTPLQQVEKE